MTPDAWMTPDEGAAAGAERRSVVRAPRMATVIGALVLVALAVLAGHAVLSGQQTAAVASLAVVIVSVGGVGLVVARHQPGNAIGWLMLGAAAWIPFSIFASGYATYVYHEGHWGIPVLDLAAFVIGQQFTLTIAVFPLVTLLFPDGRLPSARWRWALGGYLAFVMILPASSAVAAAGAQGRHQLHVLANGQATAAASPPGWVALLFFGTVAVAWLGALAYQLASWRRASGDRRQQLKWLLSGTVVCAVLGIWAVATNSAIWEVALVGVAALPVSIGVGILRYRLYDIDRIISRTLAYALVTGLLVGVYAGLVLLATEALRLSSSVSVAAATLAAAALFNPVRRRVQRAVDRRFNRARYDADRTIAAFSVRLKDAVDMPAVQADLAGVVRDTLHPAHLSIWIQHRDR